LNIHLDNVNLNSQSGPNSFASKLVKYMFQRGHSFDYKSYPDVVLSFIESTRRYPKNIPVIQRLDGIYFNMTQDFNNLNKNIRRTYEQSDGVIFQSEFNKNLTFKYFGEHENYNIIHNGADVDSISESKPLDKTKFNKVWCCASSWRPHKRLDDNIRYFLEHSNIDDFMVVAGSVPTKNQVNHDRVKYAGNVSPSDLLRLYKTSDYFIHLAWLDHCPNVVVDARASGCKIICSSTGGTKEIAGPDAIVIEEEEWNFSPVELYNPPKMDFSKKISNSYESAFDMNEVIKQYENFFINTKRKLDT